MSNKHFLTANNKTAAKTFKITARAKEKRFQECLLARMFYLTESFSDVKLPSCYKVLGGMRSVKMFI